MKKLLIIALVAVSGLEARKHKMLVTMSGSGLVNVSGRSGNDVETTHVKNGDKIILTAKDLQAFNSILKYGDGFLPEVQKGRFSVKAFDKDILKVRKTGNGFEVKAVNGSDKSVTTTLMIKADKMVNPSKHMGKMKRTGRQDIEVVVHPENNHSR